MADGSGVDKPKAGLLLAELVRLGVSHLIGLPDNGSAALFRAAQDSPDITLLTVTREGESFSIASGLWMGGQQPVVLIQNTGLLESGDSLRGTAIRMGVPLLCLIGYRGYAKLQALKARSEVESPAPKDMVRNDLDSAALVTEPTLNAWSVPYQFYRSDSDLPGVAKAWDQARRESRPVAILLLSEFI